MLNKATKQKFLQSHFQQDDHKGFLEDVEVKLIDKTQGSDPTKPEYYWMKTLTTLYPDGLNIESDYQFFFMFFRKYMVVSYVNIPFGA